MVLASLIFIKWQYDRMYRDQIIREKRLQVLDVFMSRDVYDMPNYQITDNTTVGYLKGYYRKAKEYPSFYGVYSNYIDDLCACGG